MGWRSVGRRAAQVRLKSVLHTSVSQKATSSKYQGYHEEVEAPPLLAPVVSCRKDGGGRARRRGGELAFYGR